MCLMLLAHAQWLLWSLHLQQGSRTGTLLFWKHRVISELQAGSGTWFV